MLLEEFFNSYPRFIANQLKDIALYIERTVELLDAGNKDFSLSTLEAIAAMKEQLSNIPIDLPDFLEKLELDDSNLSEEKFRHMEAMRTLIQKGTLLPSKLKEGLIRSNHSLRVSLFQP